jgi:general secretion pathway protein A
MYEDFYGLIEKPFGLTPDPRFFYASPSHGNAVELVQHALHRRDGVLVITGTSGLGKTTLCRTVLDGLDRDACSSLVLNPHLTGEELLRLILQDFGVISRDEGRQLGTRATCHDLLQALSNFLLSLRLEHPRPVVIVDEAQKLPAGVLEQVTRLAGLSRGRQPLLQLVLVGQVDLADILRRPELHQLDSRITIRYRLRPLTAGETANYIRHRVGVAAGDGDAAEALFTPKAMLRVHRASGGNPRLINLLCDRALIAALALRTPIVGPEAVTRAAHGLGLDPGGTVVGAATSVLGWMRRHVAAL